MALNLAPIRLPDGRAYPFEGFIQTVRETSGETFNIDTEETMGEDDSQTEQTIKRAAIGSALGALITPGANG
jgi:hypothetical protein